eukprot:Awhi_evm1s189
MSLLFITITIINIITENATLLNVVKDGLKMCANCCSRNGQASTEEAGQGSIENNNLKCDITQCEEGRG